MKKVIAGINMTLDGFCDHTAVNPGEDIHQHYADLINNSDTILYGRISYQLMGFWKTLAEKPSGEKSLDEFAMVMDSVPKIVFSRTLKNADWHSAELAKQSPEEVVAELKKSGNPDGKDILVGSRSLIIQLMNLNLIDEFQLCVHPVIVGSGLRLFENLKDGTNFKLLKTKTFSAGAIILYYKPIDRIMT